MHSTSGGRLPNNSTTSVSTSKNNITMTDWSESSYNLHLDLYNFESVDALDTPYVLTSPRSLEACSQLKIKPVELLHKDLAQFEEECLLRGQGVSNAKALYAEHEQQRLRKLKQCRGLRERLILQQEKEDNSRRSVLKPTSNQYPVIQSPRTALGYPVQKKVELGQGDNGNSNVKSTRQLASMHSDSNRQSELTSMINLPSQRPATGPAHRTASPHGQYRTTVTQTTITPVTAEVIMAPHARSEVIRQRSASSCSSRHSISRQSTSSTASVLSDQDQKILDLLEKKYRDEKFLEETRQEMKLAWDEQRQAEERSKVKNEMQRRQNLALANSLRQKKKEKFHQQRQLKTEQEIKDAVMDVQYKDMYHERLLKEQQALVQHQIQLKKLEELDKKTRQEIVLKKRGEAENSYRRSVSDHVTLSQERAQQLRKQKENQEAMEIKKKNAQGKVRHSSMKASLDKDNEEYTNTLKESILLKQDRARRTLNNQQWLQDHETKLRRQKEESLQEKSRRSRLEMEDENHQWQRHLMHQSLMAQERAAQQANQTVQSKASKARQDRRSRELTQRQLKQRVEEDDAIYRESVRANLAYKDLKTQTVTSQKQDAIQRSRVVAMESAKLREEIRQQYLGSFDKMVERANHQSTFGRGPQMSTKNHTTFTLTH